MLFSDPATRGGKPESCKPEPQEDRDRPRIANEVVAAGVAWGIFGLEARHEKSRWLPNCYKSDTFAFNSIYFHARQAQEYTKRGKSDVENQTCAN
jgi:hypothetical protein